MSETHQVIFLFDVDNTLLDNDCMKADLGDHVSEMFGEEARDELWALYEEERVKHGYADFLGTLEKFRLAHVDDPRVLRLANWVMDYPFIERLYPDALGAVRHVRQWGLPVILTDGRHRKTILASSAGSAGLRTRGEGGLSSRCITSTARGFSCAKGTVPVNIS
jgi:FMN phosphatase YigB (HAD superfamily)